MNAIMDRETFAAGPNYDVENFLHPEEFREHMQEQQELMKIDRQTT